MQDPNQSNGEPQQPPQNKPTVPVSLTASQEALSPIRCESCTSTNLSFVSESHKCVIGRFIFAVIVAVVLYFAVTDLQNIFSPSGDDEAIPFATYALCATLLVVLHLVINYIESKTHIKAICRDCGRTWLLD